MKIKKVFFGLLLMAVLFTVAPFEMAAQTVIRSTASGQLDGSDIIGRGYDVFGTWASPECLKVGRIFDLSKAEKVKYEDKDVYIPQHVSLSVLERGIYNMMSGESLTSYLSQLSSSTGLEASYSFYSGSIKVDFSYQTSSTKAYRYFKYLYAIHKYKLEMPAKYSSELRSLLTPDFKRMLETTKDYKRLFDTYGTHYLANAIIGGRVESNYQLERNSTTEKLKIAACVEASYNNQFGTKGSISNETVSQSELSTFSSNMTKRVNVIGGIGTAASAVANANDFTRWEKQIDANNKLTLCDFDKDSLVGIWTLASTETRQKTIEDEYNKYVGSNNTVFNDPEYQAPENYCVCGVQLTIGSTKAVYVPQGYTLISTDLNRDAGGAFIYLLVHKDYKSKTVKPITGLTAIGANAPIPFGYTKLDIDLNQGSRKKGDKIYLCYTTDSRYPAIRDIRVKTGKNTQADPGYTYVTWWNNKTKPVDANKGCGGDTAYIWIEYTTK